MINTAIPYLLILIVYLIGSIPFGVLIAKTKGIDLQKTGSGNIGATNVLRSLGKWPALVTLSGDFLKGTVSVMLCSYILGGEILESIAGITVVAGHMYPVFLSFRGGKGVATGFGVLAVYSPVSLLIILVIWVITVFITKYSSLAAIAAFISLPVVFIIVDYSLIKISFAIVLAFLIILKHKGNLRRLSEGSEPKLKKTVS